MKKSFFYGLVFVILGIIIFGFIGFSIFVSYGGNNCDMGTGCNCFCCNMFNSRGYEACGMFGLYFGMIFGMIVGLMIGFYRKKISS